MEKPRYWLHALLFVATCATTFHAGTAVGGGLLGGVEFAATLMAILVTHEMGHFVVARRHRVDVSLPYFIPMPYLGFGTLGAVIRMRSPIARRDALIDVGAAGPLAGLVVALPLLAIGIARSEVREVPEDASSWVEGNSLAYILLKLAIKGQYLPSGNVDVFLSPMALAAWVGLLVTFINLLPIGQLDGGHVAVAFFGERHERRARWLHRALLGVGIGVFSWLVLEARQAGKGAVDALMYAVQGAMPWMIWALLLFLMRRLAGDMYHPPVEEQPLSRSRRALFWVVAVVFILIFTPVPMRMAL